jgi:hypothetical protein
MDAICILPKKSNSRFTSVVHEEKTRIGRMLRSSKPDRWSSRYQRREMEALSVNIETFISGGVRSQHESLGTRWCYVWSRGAKGMGTTIDG